MAGNEETGMRQEGREGRESMERTARRYARLLGVTAGLFALLATLVNATVALSVQASVVALQRSLAGISAGSGVSIDAFAGSITGALVLAALIGLVALVIVLGFCWYAGRIAGALVGDSRAGGGAGRRVALVSGLVWLAGSLVAVLAFHADASISWLLATLGVILASPDGATLSGYAVNAAAGSFLAIQIVILLALQGIAILIALGLGALAGRAGADGAVATAHRIPVAPPMWQPLTNGQPYAHSGGYPPYPGYPASPPPPYFPPPWQQSGAAPAQPPPADNPSTT